MWGELQAEAQATIEGVSADPLGASVDAKDPIEGTEAEKIEADPLVGRLEELEPQVQVLDLVWGELGISVTSGVSESSFML